VKKVEHRRIDAFELWCWRRLLRVPWTARRPNQSILKENYIETGKPDRQLLLKSKHEVIEAWNRREESGLKEKTTWRNL